MKKDKANGQIAYELNIRIQTNTGNGSEDRRVGVYTLRNRQSSFSDSETLFPLSFLASSPNWMHMGGCSMASRTSSELV